MNGKSTENIKAKPLENVKAKSVENVKVKSVENGGKVETSENPADVVTDTVVDQDETPELQSETKVLTKTKRQLREEKRKMAAILAAPITVQKTDFDSALTKEEKHAKKQARADARKAKAEAKEAAAGGGKQKKAKKPKKETSPDGLVETTDVAPPSIKVTDAKDDQSSKATEPAIKDKGSKKRGSATKTDKSGKSDKKKKKGKKSKTSVAEKEAELKPEPSVIDQLRKRASIVLEQMITDRKHSEILRRRSSAAQVERSDTKIRSTKESKRAVGVPLIEIRKEQSIVTTSSEVAITDSTTTKKQKLKPKKGGGKKAKQKSRRDAPAQIKDIMIAPSVSVKLAKEREQSHVFFDERKSIVSQMSEVSISTDAGDFEHIKTKKRRRSKLADVSSDTVKKEDKLPLKDTKSVDGSVRDHVSTKKDKGRKERAVAVAKEEEVEVEVITPVAEAPPLKPRPMVPPLVPTMVPVVPLPTTAIQGTTIGELVVKDDAKGKKRKGKKKKEIPLDEIPMEELSVMEQIARMKAQADKEAGGESEVPTEVTETTDKKKKKKKGKDKKMTKAERAAHAAEKAEADRLAAEAAAEAAAAAERKRLDLERRMAADKARKDANDQIVRNEQLQSSIVHIERFRNKQLDYQTRVKLDEEWIEYLKCDGLPDPSQCADMNTYLHLWEQNLSTVEIIEAERKTNEVLKLLKVLDLIIESPYHDDMHKVKNWKWVRGLVRDHQAENLDTATYRLLRNINKKMNRLNIPTADYRLESANFSLCIWLLVQLPTPLFNPRTPQPPRIKLKFPEMGMKIHFPASLKAKKMAIRAMYLKYDHLSDRCNTFDKPDTPEHYKLNLQEAMANEWYNKLLYKYERRDKPKKQEITLEDGTTTFIEPEPEPELQPGQMPPQVPYKRLDPNAEQNEVLKEEEIYRNSRENLLKIVPDTTLNMRATVILGGIFYLDLYFQPPQPQSMVTYEISVTVLQRPLCLQEVPFFEDYNAPPPAAPGVRRLPEEIEEELKQQEAEFDKLILINLNMPQHVIWLDVPQVVHWINDEKIWTTKYVYDFKHIEEKNYITFRTGVFGPFALATNKYASLPYQAWELKPEIDGTVTFQITTALLMIEFNIKGHLVSMTQLQNSPNNALQDIVGTYYKLSKLKQLLVEGGVDIFPEPDAFCYVPRTNEKHYPTEMHMYEHMAQLSGVFNFSWSRWNLTAGLRNIVCQMREYKPDKQRQKNHAMLMVTPFKAVFIDCTEVSPTFNEESTTDDSKLFADLYHLMKGSYNVGIRVKVNSHDVGVITTLADLLMQTRVNSFS